jgi:hypothetical protein
MDGSMFSHQTIIYRTIKFIDKTKNNVGPYIWAQMENQGYCDLDYGEDSDTTRIVSRYLIHLNSFPVIGKLEDRRL